MADAPTDGTRHSAADWERLNANLKKANEGDEKALTWLRRFLADNPQVWRELGDLARSCERAWLELITNGDSLATESIKLQLQQLKKELMGEDPSPVERLLADTCLVTWLETRHLEVVSASDNLGG